MKYVLAFLLAGFALSASAEHGYYYQHHHNHGGYNQNWWVAPAIIGSAAIAYALSRPQPTVVVQQPVPTQPMPPYGYRYDQVFDGYCNCYRLVLVPNY